MVKLDVDVMWQKRLDEMFLSSKSELPADIQKLPLAQQKAKFRELLIEELNVSDSELAKQWRQDYNIKTRKGDFIDELFEHGKEALPKSIQALPEVEQRALFRKTFLEMSQDPDSDLLRAMWQ